MKKFCFIIHLTFCFSLAAQDSLVVMYHNILNFPGVTPNRVDSLRQIIQYVEPDVYVVNELQSEAGADLILNDALNVFGKTNYARAAFINGPDTDNGLFYNTEKLGLISQTQIGTVLRDISTYVMYYKAANLSIGADTIYFHFFSCHLKAGSADHEQRNTEATQLKYYLNSIADEVENVFVGGDFNFYSGFESGCLTLKTSGSIPLEDPIGVTGNWSNDPAFSSVHTQSTRISGGVGGDGSGGGMDDRFDMILVSEDVMNNENGVTYVNGSYEALGQDGIRFNGSIISPANTAVPDSVAKALYGASDHLPVVMRVALDETASIHQQQKNIAVSYNVESHILTFNTTEEVSGFVLYDLSGKVVFQQEGSDHLVQLPGSLSNGIYLWQLISEKHNHSGKIVVH
ncbi:MAG: T9SS type A sorting domain-containing protein [Crocinitomicaceae bacterium]